MGYYSKVAIGMTNEEAEKMVSAFKTAFPTDDLFDMEALTNKVVGKEFTCFYWDGIKWYTGDYGYTEITWVMDYLEDLRESPNPYLFVRVGEDMGDIEEIYNEAEEEQWKIHDNVCSPYYGIEFNDSDTEVIV